MQDKPRLGQRWEEYRPSKTMLFWSCVACVIATLIVGFTWGGWVTGGTAADMAKKSAEGARAALMAAVCVNRFEHAADAAAQFALLKKSESWERNDFLTKGGWVTPPGLKEPVPGAADLCVQELMNASIPPAKPSGTSG